jgi:hypothetical protein
MSNPTLKEMLAEPTAWTDYSCECLAHEALEEIIELEEKLNELQGKYDNVMSLHYC